MDTTNTSLQLIERTSRWLVDLTRAFDSWPTTLLVAALVLLVVVAGVTGKAVIGAPMIRQIIWIIATIILTLMAFAVLWVLTVRVIPTDTLAFILETLHLLKPAAMPEGMI